MSSNMNNPDIKSFWTDVHKRKFVPSLSGCTYEDVVDFLKIKSFIKQNKNVLEIGVGLGYATKGFHDNGMLISALDISEIALERVKNYCEGTYITNDLEKLPSDYFDIIICMNVVQHVPTDFLIEELKHCIRSLKYDGVFAVEFVSNNEIEDMGDANYYHVGLTHEGTCCRSVRCFESLINNIGGKCELVYSIVVKSGAVDGAHVFHVRKE